MKHDKPSTTARKVALNIISLGAKPGMDAVLPSGIVDATARLLVAAGAASDAVIRFARTRKAVALYEAFDWMIPGQFEAFAHRKAFCERQVREGIAAGATQILVLGAGYDTLGWRLAPEFPAVRLFEIDHPATGARKARGIDSMGARDNLHLIQADLGERRLEDVLDAVASWDATAPTVIIAEGLTQYLTPEAVRDLFRQCSAITGANSRFAFTFVGADEDGRPDIGRWTGLTVWILKASGEPWLWSVQPDHLKFLLEDTGWKSLNPEAENAVKSGAEYLSVAVK